MKHVLFLVLLFAVSIAKPTYEAKGKETSLRRDTFNVNREKSPAESILTKRRPLIIKSKISKPNTKKRYIGINSKPKALVGPESEKSAITFALDSDDNSLSSIISVILKLLEGEERMEIDSKKTSLKGAQNLRKPTVEISEIPILSTKLPNQILDSKADSELPQSSYSEQNEDKSNINTETRVIQATTVLSQINSGPTKPSDLQFLTTTPSNIILESSVSFEPAVDNTDEQNEKGLPRKPDILKLETSNDEEESSGDFSTESDEDSKHYCPEGLIDEDKSDREDSIVDLEKLISSSENIPKSPLEFSTEKKTFSPAIELETESNKEIQTETPTHYPIAPDSTTESVTETVLTTLEPFDVDTCLSETTTISSNILTDLEEISSSWEPPNFSTTEKQSETTTFTIFAFNPENSYETPTEQDIAAIITTPKSKNSEKAETQDTTTLSTIPKIKLDSNKMTEITTILSPYKDTSNKITTVTDQPVLISTISAIYDSISSFTSNHELPDNVSLTPESLSSVTLLESSQYTTTPVAELRMIENTTYGTVETDEKLRQDLKSAELSSSEAVAVSPESIYTTQLTKQISTPSSLSSVDISTLYPVSAVKEAKQEKSVESQKPTLNSTKPYSRLITFTLYDRKEKYTKLKHFIDYLKTIKK